MNTQTRELIRDAATFLIHFDRSNRRFLKPVLQTTLLIIEEIEKRGVVTIPEIAIAVGIHSDTASETIRMLREGGYLIAVPRAGTQGSKYLVSIAPKTE
jgi:Fic family protein